MKILDIGKAESKKINNLYHPTATLGLEAFEVIRISNCLDKENSRFLPILLKEAFGLLKRGGQLKIYYNSSTTGLSSDFVESTLWWLFKRQYDINAHILEKNTFNLTLTKKISMLKKEEGIDHWTFGMVTNGVRRNFIERSIKSIRGLKIPYYEIIICGYCPKYKGKDIRYIEFRERDDKGWVTKKKNLIAENAKYTNLCIFHDRMVFNANWYKGMKKYGNSFEVLGCVQKLESGKRVGDWISGNVPLKDPGLIYRVEEIDYRDWDKYVFIGGQLTIVKKYVWEDIPWNETLYWKEGEDIEYSYRLTERGYLPRFNPFSSCLSLSWGHGQLPRRIYPQEDSSFLHNLTDVPIRRAFRFLLYIGIKLPLIPRLISLLYPAFVNNKILKFVRSH